MKGVSAIIATILLLIITISLAGTAYIFVSNILRSKIAKSISVVAAPCNGTHITLVISNDGTDRIEANEIKIFVNNVDKGTFGKVIEPHTSEVKTDITREVPGSNNVLVISPSNSQTQSVWC